MKVLLEGLFVVVVLLLELVGVVVLGRSTVTAETYPLASWNAAPTTYIVTSEDDEDGGAYWVEWENASCSGWGAGEDAFERFFEVNRSESEVVGRGKAAGCRGHLRPHVPTIRQSSVGPSGGHRAEPASENATSSRHLGE